MSQSVYDIYEENMSRYPKRARDLMDSAFICFNNYCIHLYEKAGCFYIRVTNLYGYKTLLCKVTDFSTARVTDMRIDFVSTNMSEAKKYYVLWFLERNRETIFETLHGKYSKSAQRLKRYAREVKVLAEDEELFNPRQLTNGCE